MGRQRKISMDSQTEAWYAAATEPVRAGQKTRRYDMFDMRNPWLPLSFPAVVVAFVIAYALTSPEHPEPPALEPLPPETVVSDSCPQGFTCTGDDPNCAGLFNMMTEAALKQNENSLTWRASMAGGNPGHTCKVTRETLFWLDLQQ